MERLGGAAWIFILLIIAVGSGGANGSGGQWALLQKSIGVSAMHMQLLRNDRVVVFDRTDFGLSNLSLPAGKCRNDPNDTAVKHDCSAHSVEYDVLSNAFRPLMVLTDTWCSSGAVAPDGRLVQTGGFNDGDKAARVFQPCDGCDWEETQFALTERRWYASNQILPDGRAIVVGGRRQFNYEFYPKTGGSGSSDGVFSLPFLRLTRDVSENNLYPFLHLNVDGNLFIFANTRSILLDYRKNAVVKTFPAIPGGDPRNYPSSGSSVLLPLLNSQEAEVLICGGAPVGSYEKAMTGNFVGALATCGRIKITDASPKWSMETMPIGRVMGDMVLLPDGGVLIINGVRQGTAGWELGKTPATSPVIYRPEKPTGSRFEVQNPSQIPRVYHSTAALLRDGRVLIGGSNPHRLYEFYGKEYPTELSLEAFSPSYLDSSSSKLRPTITTPASGEKLGYGQNFTIGFKIPGGLTSSEPSVTMVAPPFITHSFSMNQRLLVLGVSKARTVSESAYTIDSSSPTSSFLAPSGYYLLFLVHAGIPSEGIWVQIQ
ncbi:aldehyde oxidase GLOX-like [Aristolochia californica]|uniref:aldehyde oxidase GLOX-like n=1 Tax=Aristolochia californica TaxID=171875 RepID=UPI0035DFDE26